MSKSQALWMLWCWDLVNRSSKPPNWGCHFLLCYRKFVAAATNISLLNSLNWYQDKIPPEKTPRTKSPLGQNPPEQNPPSIFYIYSQYYILITVVSREFRSCEHTHFDHLLRSATLHHFITMEYITSNKGGRKLAFENNIHIK